MSSLTKTVAFVAVAALAGSLSTATLSSAARTGVVSYGVGTWNCATNPVDVNYGVQISTWPRGALVSTGDPSAPETFVRVNNSQRGYTVGSRCTPSTRLVVFSLFDLVASHVPRVDCASPAHVLIKLRIGLNVMGNPVSAKIEVTQPHAPLKPLAQVVWATYHPSVTYHRSECLTS